MAWKATLFFGFDTMQPCADDVFDSNVVRSQSKGSDRWPQRQDDSHLGVMDGRVALGSWEREGGVVD